jgi:hypothetical protein
MDAFDFNNVCEDVQPFILQHFTGKDFMNMTEVSTAWNQQFEGKVAVKTHVNATKLLGSLKIRKDSHKVREIFMRLDERNRINVATTFAETVEKLTIQANEIGWCPLNKIQFPQLKILELNIDSTATLMSHCQWIVEINAEQIEELKFSISGLDEYDGYETRRFLEILADNIAGMKSLKTLDLSDCDYNVIYDMWKYGGICWPKLEVFKSEVIDFFDFFMGSLKTAVVIGTLCTFNIRDFLSKYKELETLEFDHCSQGFNVVFRVEEFKVNKKVKNLSAKKASDSESDLAIFKQLLAALPDLENLYVAKLTKDLMEFIAANNRKLKQLKFCEIEDGTVEKFEEMRRQGQKEVNLDMQLVQEIYE